MRVTWGVATIWPGTEAEGAALIQAIGHNCACEGGMMGAPTKKCAAHEAFVNDQAWLNRLVFLYRIRDRLIEAEATR